MARPKRDESRYPLPPLPRQEGVEFRYCVGLAGYAVDSLGRVWSCKVERCDGYGDWHLLSPTKSRHGRLRLKLKAGGKVRTHLVHHLVIEAFKGPRPAGLLALHGDDNPLNNTPGNLRYGTQSENMKDGVRNGKVILPNRHRLKHEALLQS